MSMTDFTWGDDMIDSRNIIARHEELQDEYESLKESLEEAKEDLENFIKIADEELTENDEDFEERCNDFRELIQEAHDMLDDFERCNDFHELIQEAQDMLDDFEKSDDMRELEMLKEIVSQGEDSSDWSYGGGLIHEDYFTQYTEELINDCHEMSEELNEGKWPFNHMKMDWDAAAEELKGDYTTIEAAGETYYIRA